MRTAEIAAMAPLPPRDLASRYLTAKETVIEAGFAPEIDWQEEVSFRALDETKFLRECAWVVLSAGFREDVVRRRFSLVSAAFLEFRSAALIAGARKKCRRDALTAFANQRKVDAILDIAGRVATVGMESFALGIRSQGAAFLCELPFIGPVTVCHLAKNIGLSVVKPDRHLMRIAAQTGYETVHAMCRVISDLVGDSLPVIDVVIWRYATMSVGRNKHLAQLWTDTVALERQSLAV